MPGRRFVRRERERAGVLPPALTRDAPRGSMCAMRRRTALVVAGAFALLSVALLARVVDFDLWWHLVVGRETLRLGRVPVADFYVYPALGTESGFHEWGFGALAFLVQRAAGFPGLAAANAALSAAGLVLLAAAAVRRGASWSAAVLVLGPLAVVSAYRFCYRPEMMLYLAFAGTLYALERRALLALPPIAFALTLFHPSGLILLLVIGCHLADALVRDRREALRLGAALAATTLAIALAPGGWHGLVLALTASQNEMNAVIGEYVPVLSSEYRWHFVGVAAVAAASLVAVRRRVSDVLLVAGFGFLAVLYVRNLTLFALAAFAPVCLAADLALRRLPRLRIAAPAALVLSCAVLVAAPTWGAGPAPGRFPEETADFILRHRPPGRLFNQLHTGGYLAWRLLPGYPVALDGRNYYGVNAALRYVDSVSELQDGWREQLERYGVTLVATPGVRPGSGRLLPFVAELAADPDWVLAVTEPAGMLFVRREAFPAGAVPLSKERVWPQVLAETAGLDASARARFARGVAYFKLRDYPRAAAEFTAYRAAFPEDREAAELLALLDASLRGDPGARAALAEIERRGRSD
jgi:hypothetical protein